MTEQGAVAVALPASPAPFALPFSRNLAELQAAHSNVTAWLWEGYLAAGNVTLLTSQWKSGKTTLLAILLAKLKAGGELAGQRVNPAKAIVLSEEHPSHWLRRGERLDFGDHVSWLCQPFLDRPTPEQWQATLMQLSERSNSQNIGLVCIDPLAVFFAGNENHAQSVLDVLAPLRNLTSRGVSVLLLHHPRKGRTAFGQAARGSGALMGHVDISVEMNGLRPGDPFDRRRRLRGYSRFPETPPLRVIELNALGTDYARLPDTVAEDEEFGALWEQVLQVVNDAPQKLTRADIMDRWDSEDKPPSKTTLWNCLDWALRRQLLRRDGTGRKNDPFYYWLPGELPERSQNDGGRNRT